MKLYKVTFETEIMILAEDEKEAIKYAEQYVCDETPTYQDSQVVESVNELGEWKGAIPYSAKRQYNVNERSCEEFVND